MDRIYLCLAHMSGKEQDFIKEAFDTNWVVPMGPNVNAFEKDLEHFVNTSYNVQRPTKNEWSACQRAPPPCISLSSPAA